MKHAGLLLLLSAACAAHAQPVYKCTHPEGGNSYQSTPCAEGETSATRAHTPSATGVVPATAPLSGTAHPASVASGQRRTQVRYTTTPTNAACDGAKAHRTAALGAAGTSAPAELRDRLDQAVQNACG